MTEQQTRTGPGHGAIPQQRTAGSPPPYEDNAAEGWVRFAAVVMAVIGTFGVIEGLVALFAPTYFITLDGAVLTIDLTAWGWVHIIIGALTLVTGVALLTNVPNWARGVGIGLVALNMLVQLAWLPAYPIWSIIAIALDMIIISALAMTWDGRVPQRR
jgi:hypothetical protein